MKNKLRLLAQIFNEIFDGDCIVVIVQHCLKSDTVNPYQNVTKCNKIPPCILVSTPQFHTI